MNAPEPVAEVKFLKGFWGGWISVVGLFLLPCFLLAQIIPREAGSSRSYAEVIESYQALDKAFANARLDSIGLTDSGRPLHLFLMGQHLPEVFETPANDQLVLLINNGIHPGESCGIDASVQWAEALLQSGQLPQDLLIAIIPVYNVHGLLHRKAHTRANQNGPELQGFRGNGRNLDLNRDFVKAEALNTRAFHQLYTLLDPDIFIDTHTSNGADYPYTMTLIATQEDKLAPPLASFMKEVFTPALYAGMEQKTWPMIPYVNVFGRPPDAGMSAFLETPRYASGYSSLHHSLGYITEAHMLKSYEARVAATQAFLEVLLPLAERERKKLMEVREQARKWSAEAQQFPINWKLDSSAVEALPFRKYAYQYPESRLGDYHRLQYLQDESTIALPYYPRYRATEHGSPPSGYIIPQAWREIVERLRDMGVQMHPLPNDSSLQVESIYLQQPSFASQPYEGRFLLTEFEELRKMEERQFLRGDWWIACDENNRYLLTTLLEPKGVDSFVRWGFFLSIYQRKEYFSTYVFEDTAEELLAEDAALRAEFAAWKDAHPEEAKNPYAVLDFIYRRSDYFEDVYQRYPVARIP